MGSESSADRMFIVMECFHVRDRNCMEDREL